MKAILGTTGSQQVDVHYVNGGVPGVVEENFGGYYLGHDGFFLEEVLQDQECVYQSLQLSDRARASTTNSDLNSVGERRIPEKGESSQVHDVQSQLALDEILAMSLQLENELGSASLNETSVTETANSEVTATNTSVEAVAQDNIDPDNMTYEQLQSLGEAIGTESKGLSDELIAYLPTSKYKTGFFSRKEKHEECVICCMEYKNREMLTTLPCRHQYHSKCVTRWLKLNKACPVCNEEVFGS